MLVGEFLVDWLAGRQALRPSTLVSYGAHIRLHLIPGIGHVPLAELSPRHLEALYSTMLTPAAGLAPVGVSTVHRIHATLMSALSHAVRRGLITVNVAALVELPRAYPVRPRVWSPAQAARFLDLSATDALGPLYAALVLLGLRRGEALGVCWVDVDLDARTLAVTNQVVDVAGQLHHGPPKSAAGRRTVALPATLVTTLRSLRRRQVAQHALAGAERSAEGPLFIQRSGQPWAPAYVSRHFDVLVARYGLPRIRLHDLRHSSASIGLASGESLLEVSRRLGHSSITVTADIYSQVSPVTARASAERLAAAITTRTWPA